MEYVFLIGLICACIAWVYIVIQIFKGELNMVIPMWISVAFIWIFNIGWIIAYNIPGG